MPRKRFAAENNRFPPKRLVTYYIPDKQKPRRTHGAFSSVQTAEIFLLWAYALAAVPFLILRSSNTAAAQNSKMLIHCEVEKIPNIPRT